MNKVDLILKCWKINKKNQTLFFHDEEKNDYELSLKVTPNNIENSVIKLRCVNVSSKKKSAYQIKLTPYSSCLLVPGYFYDARKFSKIENQKKSKNKSHKYDFMENYSINKKATE